MFKLSISRLLVAFGGLVTLGLITALAVQEYSLIHLRVGGPLFNEIVKQKDFIADILPPPLFVAEPYAAAYEAQFHEEMRVAALQRILDLKKLYDERRAFWIDNSLEPQQETLLNTRLFPAGDRFWSILLNDFVPVVGRGYETVNPILDKLSSAYNEQRQAVADLNELALEATKAQEANAADEVELLSAIALIAGSAAIVLFISGVVFLRFRAIRPLVRMTARMRELADGQYEAHVPYTQRMDEIGAIAQALLVFQQSGLAKLELEREAEAAALERRQERLVREAEAQRRAEETAIVVDQLGAGLERLSHCNIRMTIDEPFAADFEAIRNNFNRSIATFQLTLERVMEGTLDIREGSTELSSAAHNMALRTEQQAAALEETAAALEQINGTIGNLTVRSEATRKLVSDARNRAGASSAVVADAVNAMQRIATSVSEIGQIIGVIDEIAFQTNLLALNAGWKPQEQAKVARGLLWLQLRCVNLHNALPLPLSKSRHWSQTAHRRSLQEYAWSTKQVGR